MMFLILVLALCQSAPEPADLEEPRRPNLLLVLVDDQRHDMLGHVGHTSFLHGETPHIDRLFQEGARFENSFVTTSLCSPSRASLLTGTYAHIHGVWHNQTKNDPDAEIPNLGQLLQQAGYETAFFGKWHMKDTGRPRPGFDHWLGFRGQGRYEDPWFNENGRRFRAEGYITDLLTDHAVTWLRERSRPFAMILSHKALHGPFLPAPRHAKRWQDIRTTFPAKRLDQFRCLLAVDESVGRLLATLEERQILDETVVVYTSDNGFFHGEHNRKFGKTAMYDESIRVPLLLRYPRLVAAYSRVEALTLNIDLLPTFLELAGAPIPRHIQGHSLLEVLQGETPQAWRQSIFYEYFQHPEGVAEETTLGIRSHDHKYIYQPATGQEQLFDLRRDSGEHNNLAQQASHQRTLRKLRREFRDWVQAVKLPAQLPNQVEWTLPSDPEEVDSDS
jgi:N-acetylglucosamine-6-sulfatase